MAAPGLSSRLEALLGLVSPGGTLVDVGCDHALVALAAVHTGLAATAIGIDRRVEPLRAAEANVAASGLGDRVTLRLGDGLAPLAPGEGDVLVVAGMGGRSIVRILDAHRDTLAGFRQLVLQPNQAADAVRTWALAAGWHLHAEALVAEDGRYFPLLDLRPGTGDDPAYGHDFGLGRDALIRLGPWLLASGAPEALAMAREQHGRLVKLAARRPDPAVAKERAFWEGAIAALEAAQRERRVPGSASSA